MATSAKNSPCHRFGVFQADLERGELRKFGAPVKIQEKPFRVLAVLLERPGEIVTREELRERLWPANTFVEFDDGLNAAVKKLRVALNDVADRPHFIETVPKRGYRFVAPLIREEDPGSVEPGQPVTALPQPERKRSLPQALWLRFGVPAAAADWLKWVVTVAAILAVAAWYLHRPLPPLRVAQNGYTQITHDGRGKNLAGTDGSRLYFTRDYGPQSIAQVAISGGEIASIPTALPIFALQDDSPDGSSLLVTSLDDGRGSLWSVQIPSGSLRRLLTDAGVTSAAWSPDGKSVVYSTGNSDLYLIRSDGTGVRKLAEVGGSTTSLSWSPGGSRIRFFKDSRLWEMSSDGSGLHELLAGWRPSSPLCCGRWTADGKFFVFLLEHPYRGGYEPGNQIWALDERRGLLRRPPAEPIQLTSGPMRWTTPIPSKDGTKLFAQGVVLRGELVRFDAKSHQLQPWLGGISAEFVSFSPDGQFVAYVTFPEGVLWRVNRDGSNPVQLTNPPLYPINPRWSPDGAQISFLQVDPAGRLRSYIVPSQGGSTPRVLLTDEKEGTADANWSPDGSKIVFCSVQSMAAVGSSNYVLRVLDLGSHQISTLPGSDGTYSPRWSPNGRFIAGIHIGAPGGLKVFDFETQRWLMLHLKGETDWPSWSSDNQFIYFLRPRDNPGVYRVRVSNGVEERVVDLRGFRLTGALSAWFGLDPDDTPILIRDVGTADIYALTLEQK